MKRELYGQLDALQSRLCDLDELTSDSDSIISGTTAATSVQSSPRKESARKSVPPPSVSSQSVPLQSGTVLLHNVLDCLNDMALQESAQIEQCLAEVATALESCVAMNTYTIEKTGMFPHKR